MKALRWARLTVKSPQLALFASWNIISMYLFTSLILTTVIDAFSAFTQSTKSEHTITREQWRSFKHAWHEVDIHRTGSIPSRDIGKLFGVSSSLIRFASSLMFSAATRRHLRGQDLSGTMVCICVEADFGRRRHSGCSAALKSRRRNRRDSNQPTPEGFRPRFQRSSDGRRGRRWPIVLHGCPSPHRSTQAR